MSEPLILCAVADDEHASDVVATGRSLAEAGPCRLLFVHVLEPILPPHAAAMPAAAATMRDTYAPARLEEAARARAAEVLVEAGVAEDDRVLVETGGASRLIRQAADEHDAALVVLGSRRQGAVMSALRGSVSRALARDCPRPVLIAQEGRRPGGGPVVCGVQRDDTASRRAVRVAGRLAGMLGRRLVLAHVLAPRGESDPALTQGAYALLDSVREGGEAVGVELAVLEGSTTPQLEGLAHRLEASLLVIGSHGTGAVRAAVAGTVSLELTRESTRPLVIVPEMAA